MGLYDKNIFQFGFLKKARYLLSTQQRSQTCVFVSETGVVSKEDIPMHTAYMSIEEIRRTWSVLHVLKIRLADKNGNSSGEQVLMISERSHIPLDPFNKLTDEEREGITPLGTIARTRHAEERANISAGNNQTARDRMLHMVTSGSLILIGIIIIGALIKNFMG